MHEKRIDGVITRPSLPVRRSRPLTRPASLIDAIDDPRLAPVLVLRDRVERDRLGLFPIEGLRFLHMAVEKGLPIETVVYSPDDIHHPASRALLRDLIERGVPAQACTGETLLALANREDPQGLIAVTRQFDQPLAMSTPSAGLCWLAVDTIQSPGNLGTLVRTAECVGAAGLIMIGDDVDPYDPGCVRATMGAIFHQRLVRTTFDELLTWTRRHRATVVGTSPSARLDYHRVRYQGPTVLYLGCEKRGIDGDRQAECDLMVRIPMVGRGDSLNVGIAGSIMLYELFNQRRRPSNAKQGKGLRRA